MHCFCTRGFDGKVVFTQSNRWIPYNILGTLPLPQFYSDTQAVCLRNHTRYLKKMGNIYDKEVEDFKTTIEQRSVYRLLILCLLFGCFILCIVGALLSLHLKQRIAHCAWLPTSLKYFVASEIIFWMCTFLAVWCFYAICATWVDNNRKAAEEKARLMEMQTYKSVIFRKLLSAIPGKLLSAIPGFLRWFVGCDNPLNLITKIGK